MAEYMGYKNKGLYYRDKTRKRKREILKTIKDSQRGACFFAIVRNPKTGFIHGEKHFFGYEEIFGLIIENKIHYVKEGQLHYAYTNKRGFKIKKTFDRVPDCAPSLLIDKYMNFLTNHVSN